MIIREALPEDIPAISRLRQEHGGSAEFWQDRVAGYISGKHNPQMALAPRVVYVSEEDGSVIGFAAGHLTRRFECEGELQWIDVLPEQRRKGIGRALLRKLAAWFRRQRAARICVNVGFDNTVATTFYRKLGALRANPYWLIWDDFATSLSANKIALDSPAAGGSTKDSC